MKPVCLYHVEDNPADRRLLAMALREKGLRWVVNIAKDGEEALALLSTAASQRESYPDLIVLDLNLPKQSGIEVLAAIRGELAMHEVPVVVLTSSDSPFDEESVRRLGVSAYIRKPMTFDGFMEIGHELVKIVDIS